MAVKKTVKKSSKKVAKKAPAKKVAAKKVAAKKVAKKAPAKKVAAKKVVKKAPAKKSAAKKVAKKAPVKKIAKKTAKRSASRVAEKIVIPPVPSTGSAVGATTKSPTSISSTPATKSVPQNSAVTTTQNIVPAKKSSSRVVVTVIAGVALLAVAVVSRNHNNSTSTSTATSSPSASATASASSSASASASASSTASTVLTPADGTHPAPVGIVAHYTKTGATIFWKSEANASGISNYNVEISSNGGAWKLISTVPASQLSLDITKGDTTGWCSFRVSAVYSDGKVVPGKVFGLPGQYA